MLVMNQNKFVFVKARGLAKVRLICFPYAGGNAGAYQGWSKLLPPYVDLICVQPPGRGARFLEAPYGSMSELVEELLGFTSLLTELPYVVFGHSLGARAAYSLISEWRDRGVRQPFHFIASGSRAPHLKNQGESTQHLSRSDFIKTLENLEGTPKEVLQNKELMDLYLPALRADFKLAETFQATPKILDCPLSVFYGKQDVSTTMDQLLSWQDLSSKQVSLTPFSGGHFFINDCQPIVVKSIKSILSSTVGESEFV